MSGLAADCRHALRLYARTPGASLLAVLAFAIAMAFVGAFLSLYVDLVLRPHPGFEESGRITTLGQNTGTNLFGITYEAVERIADEVTSLEAAAMFSQTNVLAGTEREQVSVSMVSSEFFPGLRPRMALGRGFQEEEHLPDAEPVVVLSYDYWQRQFDGDSNVLGSFIEIARNPNLRYQGLPGDPSSQSAPDPDSAQFRVIGVTAETLPGIFISARGESAEVAFWLPIERAWPLFRGVSERLLRLPTGGTLGRRAPGVSTSAVVSELRARYEDEPFLWNASFGAQLDAIDGVVDNSVVHRDAQRQLEMFLAGSVLLALVAAANVSLFLLARAPGRRRELGVRMAVGAPLKRLSRQLTTEAGFLVVVAAALGLAFSFWLSLYLRGLSFLQAAEWSDVSLLDWRVLVMFGILLSALTVLVSLAPILGLKQLGIAAASRQVVARASLTQRLAGTMQIAVAGALGGAAIAFGWYLASMTFGNPGYAIDNRFEFRFLPSNVRIQSLEALAREMASIETAIVDTSRQREAIEALPGVSGVSFSTSIPGAQSSLSTQLIQDPVDPSQGIAIGRVGIDSRFVEVLDLQLLHGRAPSENETGVALVNQALAQRFFGREDVVGESLPIRSEAGPRTEVVGVLEDLSFIHPAADVDPMAFLSLPPGPFNVRGVIASALTAQELQRSLEDLSDAEGLELGFVSVTPLRAMRNDLLAADTARSLLSITTAGLVILLAAIGFYGTQRYLVTAGRREYAIRASLGAGPRALGQLVLWRGMGLGIPGLAVGGILAFMTIAWLRDDFVSPDVSAGMLSMVLVFALASLLFVASVGPAMQAKRTQPAPLLREE